MCSVDSVIPEAVPVSVTAGQVAGLRIRGEPLVEVGNARTSGVGRIAPERLVGDQIPQWRQTVRRRGRESLHRRSFLLARGRKTSLANLPLSHTCSVLADGP